MKFQTASTAPHAWGFAETVEVVRIAPGLYEEPVSGLRVQREAPATWIVIDPKLRDTVLGPDVVPNSLAKVIRASHIAEAKREDYTVARGSKLLTAVCYLTRYLSDHAAGTLGARNRYGFHGDARPVPRRTLA